MLRTMLLSAVALAACAAVARAEIKTKEVTYEHDGVTFKGHFAWDDAVKGKRPGVLVVHEWWGLDAYARGRAEQLAKLGYVGFACDMYGEGKTTQHPKEAGQMAGMVRKNVKTWESRAKAALKQLASHEAVDSTKLAAIGYCFGGSTVLQLAYSGADLDAVVSFHGAVPVPEPAQAKAVKAKVLISHGADDKFIPEEVMEKARQAYKAAGVDYKMIYHKGAKHSFTVPDAGKAGVEGLEYNAEADRESWQAMQELFRQVFAKKE